MSESLPSFSIVVPTHQRPKQLSACLAALANLDYPPDRFEVVVVHDGAWPNPRNGRPPGRALNVTVLSQLRAGPAAARNKGAKHAKGQYLAFTDDDCAPAPDWLRVLADQLVTEPRAVIGGRTVNGLRENSYAAASQLVVQTVYAHFNGDYGGRFFASNNLALATDAFHDIGGFDASFPLAAGEDRDFCDRCREHGYALRYAPDAVIEHFHPLTLRRLWRQQWNYGRGARFYRAALKERRQAGGQVEWSFYPHLLRAAAANRGVFRAVESSALVLLTQIAYAAGFARETAASVIRRLRPRFGTS